jgi:hypothetical protein
MRNDDELKRLVDEILANFYIAKKKFVDFERKVAVSDTTTTIDLNALTKVRWYLDEATTMLSDISFIPEIVQESDESFEVDEIAAAIDRTIESANKLKKYIVEHNLHDYLKTLVNDFINNLEQAKELLVTAIPYGV